jgi:hypothetical protein
VTSAARACPEEAVDAFRAALGLPLVGLSGWPRHIALDHSTRAENANQPPVPGAVRVPPGLTPSPISGQSQSPAGVAANHQHPVSSSLARRRGGAGRVKQAVRSPTPPTGRKMARPKLCSRGTATVGRVQRHDQSPTGSPERHRAAEPGPR